MSSWQLFVYLTSSGTPSLHHAIWRRELRRTPDWVQETLWPRLRQAASFLFLLVVSLYAASWCLAPWTGHILFAVIPWRVLYILVIPGILLPSLALWILPLGLTIGPTIARERLNQTWDMLRLIPADLDSILLTKLSAAIWPIYPLIRLGRIVLLLTALGAATLSLNLFDSLTLTYPFTYSQICGSGIGLILAGAALFLLDRMQQFTLMGAAALAASASAQSTQRGMTLATLATGFAWLVDVGIAGVGLAVLPLWVSIGSTSRAAILVMLGPVSGYMAELHIHEATICIVGTFIVREIAIRALWWWTVRAATYN